MHVDGRPIYTPSDVEGDTRLSTARPGPGERTG